MTAILDRCTSYYQKYLLKVRCEKEKGHHGDHEGNAGPAGFVTWHDWRE